VDDLEGCFFEGKKLALDVDNNSIGRGIWLLSIHKASWGICCITHQWTNLPILCGTTASSFSLHQTAFFRWCPHHLSIFY
jgi:hypothetical protein